MNKLAAISISALVSLTEKMRKPSPHRPAGVAYYMDGKTDWGTYAIPGGLDGDSSYVRKIDCSGFVRYSAAKCSDQQCILPDGSVQMHEWLKALLKPVPYAEAAKDPSGLYICFIAPTFQESGHVWWLQNGQTMESHGHTQGVDRRPWDTPVLVNECCACYLFPSKE